MYGLGPYNFNRHQAVAHAQIYLVDNLAVFFEEDIRPPVDRHETGMVILDTLQKEFRIPTASLYAAAIVTGFDNDRQFRPEGLGHFSVIPVIGPRVDHDAVIADRHAFAQSIIGDGESFARFVMTGEIIADTEQSLFEMLKVQVNMQFLYLDLILFAACMRVPLTPEPVSTNINEFDIRIVIIPLSNRCQKGVELFNEYGIIKKRIPRIAIFHTSLSVLIKGALCPCLFDPLRSCIFHPVLRTRQPQGNAFAFGDPPLGGSIQYRPVVFTLYGLDIRPRQTKVNG